MPIRFLERLRAVQHDPGRRDFDAAQDVLQSVIGYVGKLLNTRQGSTVLDEAFGIPDFTSIGVGYSRDDIPRLEREIAAFIGRCEPRLRGVKVAYAPDPNEPFNVNFILEAALVLAEGQEIPVRLKTRVNSSGRVNVSE